MGPGAWSNWRNALGLRIMIIIWLAVTLLNGLTLSGHGGMFTSTQPLKTLACQTWHPIFESDELLHTTAAISTSMEQLGRNMDGCGR